MKHVDVTVRPRAETAPDFWTYLIESPDVTEARAVDWNRAQTGRTTHLFSVDGDAEQFADIASRSDAVDAVTLASRDDTPTYALLDWRERDVPLFDSVLESISRPRSIVRSPIVYRDGRLRAQLTGDPDAIQAMIDDATEAVPIQINSIGSRPAIGTDPTATLSDRQREAVETAIDLDYYDHPRQASHDEIAAQMDCAPNTVSDHLQKAEAKIITAVMNDRTQ